MTGLPHGELELWGGPECTVNRVGDRYRDQLIETGHHERFEDLERFSHLGLTSLRYPLLWERICANAPDEFDWAWSDARMAEIQRLGMHPIAGLLHHGSGPRYTGLDTENFITLFSDYAGAVARRYPWVRDWTPINEPLTTARFSALYGFWYPHSRDEGVFWRCFLNQIDAIRGAMGAIRAVNPGARLIQTEDLGETFATSDLYQEAQYANQRRWLTWDLLAGNVTKHHPLWDRIASFGFAKRLGAMAGSPCPPDVVGINHYLTSNRLLDNRIAAHRPLRSDAHVDIDAIRHHGEPHALDRIIRETWQRYRLPMALTESHNGCTRDEQMRWTHDAWQTVLKLRGEGVDVRAVTAWSLVGNVDWSNLLTCKAGVHESGAFAVANGAVRPTAMTKMLQGLRTSSQFSSEPQRTILSTPGWWKRPIRFVSTPYGTAQAKDVTAVAGASLLITGITGRLGEAFQDACMLRGLPWHAASRRQLDPRQPSQVADALDLVRPWAVINATGWSQIDAAENAPDRCFDINTVGAENMALACAERNIPCVTISSDQVFNGCGERGYYETDAVDPVNVYGLSKVRAEASVLRAGGRQLVIRSAAFFSAFRSDNFAMQVAEHLSMGEHVHAAGDCVVSATYVPDLVNAILDLLIDGENGVWHLTNGEPMSWYKLAHLVAEGLDLDGDLIVPSTRAQMRWQARRPAFVPLCSHKAVLMPSLSSAISRFAQEFRAARPAIRSDDKGVCDGSLRDKKRIGNHPERLAVGIG